MLRAGQGIYLQIPGEHESRVLHPAMVLSRNDKNIVAELDERELPFVCEEPVMVYFDENKVLMQQTARVEAYEEAEPGPLINLEVTGEPASAESRENHRVSTVLADLTAEIDEESQCPLLDVSVMGFSVLSSRPYKVGQLVSAVLWYAGQRYAGTVCVQSVRDLGNGRIRYGFHAVDDARSTGTLNRGLERMTAAFQRQQLQRLSGLSGLSGVC